MTARKTTSTKHNGHVSLAREEYDAFVSREDSFAELTSTNAKHLNRVHDLTMTCQAQATRMSETDLKVQTLERINGLQRVFIDHLRAEHPSVASLEEISEFWRQWIIHTENKKLSGSLTNAETARYEPNLFRSWQNWIRDAGKADRVFGEAGSMMAREQRDAAAPRSAAEMQEHVIRRLREDNAKLRTHAAQLESEIEEATRIRPITKGAQP